MNRSASRLAMIAFAVVAMSLYSAYALAMNSARKTVAVPVSTGPFPGNQASAEMEERVAELEDQERVLVFIGEMWIYFIPLAALVAVLLYGTRWYLLNRQSSSAEMIANDPWVRANLKEAKLQQARAPIGGVPPLPSAPDANGAIRPGPSSDYQSH